MARRIRSLRLATLLVLLSIPSCSWCAGDHVLVPVPTANTPVVDSVVVRPGTIHATAGSEFSLKAVAKGYLGLPVTVPAAPGLTIGWEVQGASSGVVQDAAANPAIVVAPQSPGTSFQLRARVTRARPGWPDQDTWSHWVTVNVTPDVTAAEGGTDDSDWIRVEHIPGNPPAAVLVQAAEGSAEVADWAVGIVGAGRLGHDFQSPGSATAGAGYAAGGTAAGPSELAVFARDRAMELWPPEGPPACRADPPACPWTQGMDFLVADPLDEPLFRVLPLQAAVVDLSAQVAGVPVATWAEGQAKQAFAMLNGLRAGIGLSWDTTFQHALRDPDTGAPAPVENPDAVCGAIDTYISPHSVRQPIPELFIVFVPGILGAAGPLTGFTCTPFVDWVGRVILISTNDYNVTTLVHEIGHVLSLNGSYLDGAGGHTNGRPGFDIGNLMDKTDYLPYRAARSHLTLGQLYRMNAHPHSWLNTILGTDLMTRSCATSPDRGVCPALAADLGG